MMTAGRQARGDGLSEQDSIVNRLVNEKWDELLTVLRNGQYQAPCEPNWPGSSLPRNLTRDPGCERQDGTNRLARSPLSKLIVCG